jgi:hypothetical protein
LREIPLTRDEFAAYKAFIDGERSRGEVELLVVDHTGPLTPDDGDYATCMKGFPKPASKQHPRSFEHKLEQEWNVHLVNAPIKAPSGPGAGFIVIRPGDPQKSLPDESSKSQPAKIQCSTQFSEIIFDRRHRRAAFWAGMSCTSWGGPGGTLVFKREGQSWNLSDSTCPTGIP